MTSRVMADSGPVAASRIPAVAPKATIVAASPGWSARTWAPLANRGYTRLRYTHDGTDWSADILDVEPAYAQPGDVPGWLDRRKAAGLGPGTVYANVSRIAQVKAAAGGRPFYWWASDQSGFPHGVPGAVAVQWFGKRQGSLYRGVDVSLVTSASWPPAGAHGWWRGVDPPPGPDPLAPTSSSAAPAGAVADYPAAADSGYGSGGLGGGWLLVLAAGGAVVAWLVIRDERKGR